MDTNDHNSNKTNFENVMSHLLNKLSHEMKSFGGYPLCKYLNINDSFFTGPFPIFEKEFDDYLSRLTDNDFLKLGNDYFFLVDENYLMVITKKKVDSKDYSFSNQYDTFLDAIILGPSEDFYIKYRRHDSDKNIHDLRYDGAIVSTICNGDLNSISDDYFYSWDASEIPSVIDIGDVLNLVSFDYLKSKIIRNQAKVRDRIFSKKES